MNPKLISITLIVLLLLVAGVAVATAQEPGPQGTESPQSHVDTSFTYQGQLQDGGGPANGTYDLQFKLYDAATGGNQVGSTLSIDGVEVSNGLFAVELDFGSVFDGTALWIEIGVRPAGGSSYTTLTPRQSLSATPFALTLRPGARIVGPVFGSGLNVENTITTTFGWGLRGEAYSDQGTGVLGLASADSGVTSGVRGVSQSPDGRGVFGYASADSGNPYGVLGSTNSSQGAGVRATNNADGPDLILGGTADSPNGDNGRISSDPEYLGSDLMLVSYDGVFAMLDQNNGGETGEFEVHDGADTRIFRVNENRELSMFLPDGTETIEMLAEEGNTGGQLILRKTDGSTSITIDAEYGTGGDGRITTEVIEITGGSDLSEQFDVRSPQADLAPSPGMVVCIDSQHPGELTVCSSPYDRTVAGVISGAGDVQPGMLMGQTGTEADGGHPVALTGRVYVRADASNGAIQPGDLLTSGETPGHAIKVTDYEKAQGAILGKAMGSLRQGQGLILVLVSLQ